MHKVEMQRQRQIIHDRARQLVFTHNLGQPRNRILLPNKLPS
jgi:hypothetical protein